MSSAQQRSIRDAVGANAAARFVRLAAALTVTIGAIALAGWIFELSLLKSVLPGAVEMKANTAVCLILAGCALFIFDRTPLYQPLQQSSRRLQRLAQALGLIVCALGLATLGEYLLGWQLDIDELLFRDTGNAYNAFRGRMSPYSAAAFIAIGGVFAILPKAAFRHVVWLLSMAVMAIGAVSLLGYLWNVSEFVTDRWLPPVAVHTAVAFLLLGTGSLLVSRRPLSRHKWQSIFLTRMEIKILAGFTCALLLLLIGGGYTYRTTVVFADSANMVAHTQEVRASLGPLYGAISDAETIQRNYIITGLERQLDAYPAIIAKVKAQSDLLAGLIADNAVQVRNLAQITRFTAKRFDLLAHGIDLRRRQNFDAAKNLIERGEGASLMHAILVMTERMDAEEKKLLVEREATFVRTRQRALVSLVLTMFAATYIFALLYSSIHKEMIARNEAEQALVVAKEAADAANRAKSTFLATVSHEIRTPMNGVLGMVELLSVTKLDAEQRTTLEVVHESGRSLLRIIDGILDFSKIEAGKLDIRNEVVSLTEVIENVRNLYAGNASSKGLLLKFSVNPEISPALRVDPLRLGQILNNFVSNAIKFTAEGHVDIRAQLIERTIDTTSDATDDTTDDQPGSAERVRFSVQDTGIGISTRNQQRLFQPFSQADGDTTRRYGGTGLGLAICQRLAELMGGTVEMASEPDVGTIMTLTLSLPVADPEKLPKVRLADARALRDITANMRRTAPSATLAESERTLVLLVDDHPTNRMLLTRQVNVLGYAAESAENGVEAMNKWQSGRYAMIITDCHMPEMDGYELTRRIRRIEATRGSKRTPIVACTANALGGEAESCFAAGMDDYLVKPVELTQLLKKLDQWVPIPGAASEVKEQFQATASERPPENAPVDRAVLAAISGGDAAVERDIFQDFQHTTVEDTAVLKQSVQQADVLQVTRTSHRIKGASRMVGAINLADICERIERCSRNNDWKAIAENMESFDQELTRLNAYVDALRGRSLRTG